MDICPTCRFIIPEGAQTCRVCQGDPAAVVIEQRAAADAPARRRGFGAGRTLRTRTARRGVFARLPGRAGAWYARHGRTLRLTTVFVVGAASTALIVAPPREPGPPAAVVDIAPVDAYDWKTYRPEDGSLTVDLPSEPVPRSATDGMEHHVDLGALRVVVGAFTLDDPPADPLAELRATAARTGATRRAPVQELGTGTHAWGPSLDVRIDHDGDVLLLRLTIAGERLYVLEGDLPADLAAEPESRARDAYERVLASFRPGV